MKQRHLSASALTKASSTAIFFFVLLAVQAGAETLYTAGKDTPVRDEASMTAPVVAHLPAGSMIETIKPVGTFLAISYIYDHKVKTGYAMSSDIVIDPLNPAPTEAPGPEAGTEAPPVSTAASALSPRRISILCRSRLKPSRLSPRAEDSSSDGLKQRPRNEFVSFP